LFFQFVCFQIGSCALGQVASEEFVIK
jgi:hypothetical protein